MTLDVYRERIIERESIFFVPPFKELNQRLGKNGTEKKKMTGHRRRHGGGSSSSSSWSNVRLLLFILLASTNKAVVKADNLGKNKSPFNYFFRLNKKNKKRTRKLREMRVIRNWRMQDKEGRKEGREKVLWAFAPSQDLVLVSLTNTVMLHVPNSGATSFCSAHDYYSSSV